MTKDEHIKYWLESAQYDFETAQSLFQNKKFSWTLFLGHLVLEKILKAKYVQDNDNQVPPKLHDLVRLSELTKLTLTEEQKLFLDEVNDFNLEARYPDYKQSFYKKCTEDFTAGYFKKIEEYYQWLKFQLK
ncbi:MAG: HEPN domain-containing protein [Deltaproteobacteria bacterium]|nr:HEPN domain-containing protein [Deltaproteobacteria bacterium]